MLIITRRVGQAVQIMLNPAIDPMTPIGKIFACGPIEVIVTRLRDSQVRLGVQAHPALTILREELTMPANATARLRLAANRKF